uniref:Uncharacterized protein n=1 Tax=Rhizophora mucronata TaxID=61149 RepID=A0A2P2NQ11_RHIMU
MLVARFAACFLVQGTILHSINPCLIPELIAGEFCNLGGTGIKWGFSNNN